MSDKELRSQLEGLFSDLEKPIRAEEGQPAFLEDTVEDITERKREEERVRRSQKTLQTLLDSMPFGVIIIGKTRRFVVPTMQLWRQWDMNRKNRSSGWSATGPYARLKPVNARYLIWDRSLIDPSEHS